MKLRKFLLTPPIVAISAALFCGALFAEGENTFEGTVDNDWSNGDNWSLGHVPQTDEAVVIDGKTVVAQGKLTVGSLKLSGAAKLTVKANEIPVDKYDEVFCDEATTLDALRAAAAVVQIAGSFTVDDTAVVRPEAATVTGVPVIFRVGGDFTLAEGAKFYTRRLGWGWNSGLWKDKPSDYCKPRKAGSNVPAEKGWTFAIGSGLNYSDGGQYGSTATGTSWQGKTYAKAYGPSFAPLFSGSPGGSYNGPDNGRGSGSIVVLAKGDAKIDGTLDANGGKMADKDTCDYSGSSGGGIWLAAASFTFGANALLTAEGGDCSGANSSYGPGGGGRIALAECCTDEEIDELYAGRFPETLLASPDIAAVRASVIGGLKPNNGARSTATGSLSYVHPATMPVKMTVRIFGEGTVTYDGVTYDKSFDVKVPVATDLQLTAAPAAGSDFVAWCGETLPVPLVRETTLGLSTMDPLTVAVTFRPKGEGSCVWTGNGSSAKWYDPENWEPVGTPSADDDVYLTGVTLTVEGDWPTKSLAIAGKSRITFKAASFDGESTAANLYAHASVVKATGAIVIDGTSVITVANDQKTGAAVKFDCATFYLGSAAKLTASEQGWYWYAGNDDEYRRLTQGDATSGYWQTRAPGAGGDSKSSSAYSRGAGYGGAGGGATATYGKAYGNAYAPFLPGSPNGLYNWSIANAKHPGGTIWIKCSGLCELYGPVTADGQKVGDFGGPSGGGIWICAKGVKASTTTLVSALGGDTGARYSSFGAGGRIALALGCSDEQLDALAALADGEEPPPDLGVTVTDGIELFETSVLGGGKGGSDARGNPGTVKTVTGPYGFVNMTVAGSPVNALGVEPAYGIQAFEGGTKQTFTAPEYGVDPNDPSVRYLCAGFTVTDASGVVTNGSDRTVEIEIKNTSLVLTWQWGAAQSRTIVRKPEHGTLVQGGVPVDGDAIQWPEGVMTAVEVIPDEGYEFLCWEGNAPLGTARDNPLAAKLTEPLDVTPVLRPVAEAMTRTWKDKATGDWKTAANWEPAGIPGAGDTLVVSSGTVTFSNLLAAAALSISGGTVKVGAAGNVSGEIIVAGDVGLTGGSLVLGFGAEFNQSRTLMKGHARLAVGGDLSLANNAQLHVYGGPVDADYDFASGCSFVEVGGALTLEGTSTLAPYSDYMTGGSVKITADSVFVAETAQVDANEKGYMWLDKSTPPDAPGLGYDYLIGASHGGQGGIVEGDKPAAVYDEEMAPKMPGSPNGVYSSAPYKPGGLIRIHANSITVNGKLVANARTDVAFGGASGGSIWLTANEFAFGARAVLAAMGGPAKDSTNAYASKGGGGRISIGWKLDETRLAELAETGTWTGFRKRHKLSQDDFRAMLGNDTMAIELGAQGIDSHAFDGSFTFVDGRILGLMLLVK